MSNLNWQTVTALILSLMAIVVGVISMATDHWADVRNNDGTEAVFGRKSTGSRGIVRKCTKDAGCVTYESMDAKTDDYIRGCLACMSLAFISSVVALITLIAFIVDVLAESTTRIMKFATIFFLCFTIFWYIIALIVFATLDPGGIYSNSEEDYTLSWSWGIIILAIVLDIFAIVMLVLPGRKQV